MDNLQIGNRLKLLRKKRGIRSQDLFAELLDVAERKTVGKWETGETAIPITRLAKICDVLECDLDYLFGKIEMPKNETTDVCKATGLSEKAVGNLKRFDYFYKTGVKKVPFPDMSGLYPTEVLSRLLESEAFWRVLGNLSLWTRAEAMKTAELLDQCDPTAGGLPKVPGYLEPNPALEPFKESARELYMATATKRFGDAVEEIFADLLEQQRWSSPPEKETTVTLEEEQNTRYETSGFYERQSTKRRCLSEEINSGTEDLLRAMKTPEK